MLPSAANFTDFSSTSWGVGETIVDPDLGVGNVGDVSTVETEDGPAIRVLRRNCRKLFPSDNGADRCDTRKGVEQQQRKDEPEHSSAHISMNRRPRIA
jgi:hypothetical protein